MNAAAVKDIALCGAKKIRRCRYSDRAGRWFSDCRGSDQAVHEYIHLSAIPRLHCNRVRFTSWRGMSAVGCILFRS